MNQADSEVVVPGRIASFPNTDSEYDDTSPSTPDAYSGPVSELVESALTQLFKKNSAVTTGAWLGMLHRHRVVL